MGAIHNANKFVAVHLCWWVHLVACHIPTDVDSNEYVEKLFDIGLIELLITILSLDNP